MIKLLLLMLEIISFGLVSLGSVTSTYSYEEVPSYDHKTLITLETQFEDLNNHSLAEVFEDGNLIINGDFDTNDSSWTSYFGTVVFENGYAKMTGDGNIQYHLLAQTINVTNKTVYMRGAFKHNYTSNLQVKITGQTWGTDNLVVQSIEPNTWVNLSGVATMSPLANSLRLYVDFSSSDIQLNYNSFYDNAFAIDMTALGISDLTVVQMDFYYSLYQDCVNDIDNYIYTTYDFTPSEITLNHILIIALSLGLWYVIFKLIRGLLP